MLELCDAFERSADDEAVGRDRVHRAPASAPSAWAATCASPPARWPRSAPATSSARAWRRRCATTASRSSAGCAATASAAATSSTWSPTSRSATPPAAFGQAGPKIGNAPLWWGCQLIPAVVGEKKAREVLFLTRQYTRRRGAGDGPGQRGRGARGARRRGRPLVHRDPAPLAPGAAAGQDRHERRHRRPLLLHQPRDGADGAEPRLRPRARGGHRELPGEAAGRLAALPRGAGTRAGAADGGRVERLVRARGPDAPGSWPRSCAPGGRAPGPRLPEVRRRPLGELRRGQRARQPGRQRPDRPRRGARASRSA